MWNKIEWGHKFVVDNPIDFLNKWSDKLDHVVDAWFERKKAQFWAAFWDGLDGMSMLAMCAFCLLSMFGLESPKKWMIWTVAIYMTLRFLQLAYMSVY